MSKFELFLIVSTCVIPMIALLMFLPKIKFKKKTQKVEPTKTYAELKAEEKVEPAVEEVKPKEFQPLVSDEISTDEFKSYLERKKQDISKPKRVELPSDFKDVSMPYMPRRKRQEKPRSVSEEIKNLSPELKAMLIAGVLDKKDYD